MSKEGYLTYLFSLARIVSVIVSSDSTCKGGARGQCRDDKEEGSQ